MHLAKYLPHQGPIKNFIHHNTLRTFQQDGFTFHEAIRAASEIYGTRKYIPLEGYRKLYKQGHISQQALHQVMIEHSGDSQTLNQLLNVPMAAASNTSLKNHGGLSRLAQDHGVYANEIINPLVVRLLGNYLDQGIVSLTFARQAPTFWACLRKQLAVARPVGFSRKSAQLILENSAEELIEKQMASLLPQTKYHEAFLLEVLLQLPGWAGLVHQVELNPSLLFFSRSISINDYLAVYLVLLESILPPGVKIEMPPNFKIPSVLKGQAPLENETDFISKLWHEAWELSYYQRVMAVLANPRNASKLRSSREKTAKVQAFFCIDDRSCSTRRLLEEFLPDVETFGVAGFYEIDAMHLAPYHLKPARQLPAMIDPHYLLRSIPRNKKIRGKLKRQEMNFWHRHANHLYSGWLLSYVFSVLALFRLLVSVFLPRKNFATASAMIDFDQSFDLHYEKGNNKPPIEGLIDGYTVPEMAERVGKVLQQTGLTRSFAPLVFITGHGSSSTNNPYFAAYDCGACGGHSGAINAKAFALMANRDDVRALLKKKGLSIPDETTFVGALHDTARDEFLIVSKDKLPAHVVQAAEQVAQRFRKVFMLNTRERSRRFAMLPAKLSPKKAAYEAKRRSAMLFEPRPEYNHATNSLAIVGRRLITENTFFDRRAFLNSYDPASDKDGATLEQILMALVPVCAGINLEYLFSTFDSEIFGAGSKLPHNVIALLGLANGSEGDLRTGLPTQMTEIHDPLRLLVIIEQKQSIVQKVLKGNEALFNWVKGGWIYLAIYNPSKNEFRMYKDNHFTPVNLTEIVVPTANSSLQITKGKRDTIDPARINPQSKKGTA